MTTVPDLLRISLVLFLGTSWTVGGPTHVTGDEGAAAANADREFDSEDRVDLLLQSLGAPEFAVRERAATGLIEMGIPILPRVRQLADESGDAEVRLRAELIYKHLAEGDLNGRIDDFLAGKEIEFEGWEETKTKLGDSIGIRKVFVEMMNNHPELTQSLSGSTRDHALAMDRVYATIENAMFNELQMPSVADAFALLLLTNDLDLSVEAAYERLLLSVLIKEPGTKIRKDPQLRRPAEKLLNRWVPGSAIENRFEVLDLGVNWGLESIGSLAVKTLREDCPAETLAFALQVVAREGRPDQVRQVTRLLDDERVVSDQRFSASRTQTQLGDAAMATIASMYDVDLKSIGFQNSGSGGRYAFALSEVGFRADDDSKRRFVRDQIQNLLTKNSVRPIRTTHRSRN